MTGFPRNWTFAPVSELLIHDIGGIWGKEPGVDEADVLVVRVADFRDTGSVSLGSAPLRSVTRKQLASRKLVPGDILLEKSGGGPNKPVGRVARIQGGSHPVVPTNFVQLLRPDGRLTDSAFLFWWLWYSHLSGQSAAFQRATTNIRNLQTQEYLRRAIPLPPLNEQRRIVAAIEEHLSRLDTASDSLERVMRQIGHLERLSVSAALEGDWPVEPLGDVATTASGGTPSRRRPDLYGGAIPWVKSGELRDGRVRETSETITEEALGESSAKVFERGTLLIALYGATVGKLGILDIEAATNQAVCAITPHDREMSPYLWHVLRSRRSELVAAGQGGAQPNISQAILRRLLVPVPPPDEQRRIVALVEEQLSAIDTLHTAILRTQRRSASLRRTVLERAFQGELVPQDPSDEPASVLMERIRAERAADPPPSTRRRATA